MNSILWNSLSDFVGYTCADRDASHGHAHMQQVAINSLKIYDELNIENDYIRDLVITAAWLHDVTDHKYESTDGEVLKEVVHNYLSAMYPDDSKRVTLLENIIKRVSYSVEVTAVKKGEDWQKILGDTGMLVRNIVSDADKLEAIGKMGVDRSILYGRIKHPGISDEDLIVKVREHSVIKMLRLKDQFIRTEPGKKMAEPLHKDMVMWLGKLEEFISEVR